MESEILQPHELAAFDFDSLLTAADVEELEKTAKSWGRNRRLALCVLEKSKSEMMRSFDESDDPGATADALMDMYDHIKAYKEFLAGLSEQADIASTRLLVVLAAIKEGGRV